MFEPLLRTAHLELLKNLVIARLYRPAYGVGICSSRGKAVKERFHRKPLYGDDLGMFMQITNLGHVAAHLEYSTFTNIRTYSM